MASLSERNFTASWHAVEYGQRMHFILCELLRHYSHLLEYVVFARALRKGGKLAFDIGRMLSFQGRRPELVAARAMAGRARRDAALRIAGKDKALRRIGFPQAATHSGMRLLPMAGSPSRCAAK